MNNNEKKIKIQKHIGTLFDFTTLIAILIFVLVIANADQVLPISRNDLTLIGIFFTILTLVIAITVPDLKNKGSYLQNILKVQPAEEQENEEPNISIMLKDGTTVLTYKKYPTKFASKVFNHPYKVKYVSIYPYDDRGKNGQILYIPIDNITYIKKI